MNLYIIKLLKSKTIQIIILLSIYALIANKLPIEFSRFLYTISIFIKDTLILLMPIIVYFLITSTIIYFEKKALLFILILFIFEFTSNFASVIYSFFAGTFISDNISNLGDKTNTAFQSLDILWRLPFIKPYWWKADKGCYLALITGIIFALACKNNTLKISKFMLNFISKGKNLVEWFMKNIFSNIVPIFILGFFAQMYMGHMFDKTIYKYALLLIYMILITILYIMFLFMIGASFNLKKTLNNFMNLAPAGAVGFTLGCSLSTMPWTIVGAGKNMKNPELAKALIPATVNIQMVGDCIANAFLCFVIYFQFFGVEPTFIMWLKFSIVFTLARFTTVAISGGAMFIMFPIYESYLDFTSEMIAIILTFNILLDPIITAFNIIGNGALCRVFEMFWNYISNIIKNDQQIK